MQKLNKEKELLIIKKFSAEWCSPCKKYDPIIDRVVSQNEGVDLERIDIEEEPKLASTYGVMSVPYTVFENEEGKVFGGVKGTIPEKTLQQLITDFKELA